MHKIVLDLRTITNKNDNKLKINVHDYGLKQHEHLTKTCTIMVTSDIRVQMVQRLRVILGTSVPPQQYSRRKQTKHDESFKSS